MKYGTVCSGIEAPSQAWHPLGWQPVFFSEIEPFPSAVLKHHYPDVPNLGDMTQFKDWPDYELDLICGGTPCQSFSVAGLRKGMADPRGNLALTFLAIVDRYRPTWLVWENVPGVLSSNGGRDFGAILGGMVELGYGVAYRVLDAQYFGVPQRRRRVFVVGHLGDWRRAAAVLFERHSLQGHPAPRREAGKVVAPTISARPTGGGGLGTDFDLDGGCVVTSPTLRAGGHSGSHANAGVMPAVAFHERQGGQVDETPVHGPLTTGGGKPGQSYAAARIGMQVRRLTPRECERLQGFPDDYTLIQVRNKPAADGPRYKALGNSMAVPVLGWIGRRIDMVESIPAMTDAEQAVA